MPSLSRTRYTERHTHGSGCLDRIAVFHRTRGSPFSGGYFLPDPLVVFPLHLLLEHSAAGDANSGRISIAPDVYHKADFSGGAPYEMVLPDARADGELLNERHGLFFVDYLRLGFRWGGFPGYDGLARLPGAIAVLRAELLAF